MKAKIFLGWKMFASNRAFPRNSSCSSAQKNIRAISKSWLSDHSRILPRRSPCFPTFRSHVKRLYLMGGAYWKDYSEHNIEMDVLAAKIVFESGIPITAIGLDVTLRVWMREKEVEQIRNLPNDLGSMLEGQIKRWWRFLGTNQNNPHDPLAALAMVRPDLFSFAPCDVAICMENDRRGRLIRRDDPNGKIQCRLRPGCSERREIAAQLYPG